MRTREIYELGFDPDNPGDGEVAKVFKNRTAQRLWVCLGADHLIGPGFASLVLRVAQDVDEANRKSPNYLTFEKFMEIVRPLSSDYGRVSTIDTGLTHCSTVDTEFWADIYKSLFFSRMFKLVKKQELIPRPDLEPCPICEGPVSTKGHKVLCDDRFCIMPPLDDWDYRRERGCNGPNGFRPKAGLPRGTIPCKNCNMHLRPDMTGHFCTGLGDGQTWIPLPAMSPDSEVA